MIIIDIIVVADSVFAGAIIGDMPVMTCCKVAK
jgi:hypothetical protein